MTAKPMGKAPAGEGCPRCEGPVYAAEQMLARGRVSINHEQYFSSLLVTNVAYHRLHIVFNLFLCFMF